MLLGERTIWSRRLELSSSFAPGPPPGMPEVWKNTVGDQYARIVCAYVKAGYCYCTFENKKFHCSVSSVASNKDTRHSLLPPFLRPFISLEVQTNKSSCLCCEKAATENSMSPHRVTDISFLVAFCLYKWTFYHRQNCISVHKTLIICL